MGTVDMKLDVPLGDRPELLWGVAEYHRMVVVASSLLSQSLLIHSRARDGHSSKTRSKGDRRTSASAHGDRIEGGRQDPMRLNQTMKRAAVTAGRLMPRPDTSTRRVVFCYHSVHPDRSYVSTKPEVFERHIQWLNEHCRLASLADVVGAAAVSHNGKPVVAITFDDGYEDNHSYALPILVKYETPATFFITAGLVDRDPAVLRRFQQLLGCGPDDVAPLDWAQVRELRDSGMDIGSHTYSHPNLARLSREETEEELRTSRDLISDRLGAPIDLFAYPFGKPRVHFTSTTTEVARATGYRVAAAVTSRGVLESDPLLRIPRFFADGDSLSKLEAKIQGVYELLGWWQDHVPLSVMRIVSPQDFKR
jgi:peptidoglycan/xylan/chitin deacetylase (PgdA/CDA1 family)